MKTRERYFLCSCGMEVFNGRYFIESHNKGFWHRNYKAVREHLRTGKTLTEIAKIFGVPFPTFTNALHRAERRY